MRLRARIGLVLGCAVMVVPGACASAGEPAAEPGPNGEDSAPRSSWDGSWCEPESIRCEMHGGLPTVTIESDDAPGTGTVLVDLGGPGTRLRQGVEAALELGMADDHDVLLVGERWEVDSPPSACLAKEAARLRTFDRLSEAACDLGAWGFEVDRRRAAVDRATADSGAPLVAGVGISFGAVRVASVTEAGVPLLLVTPAPPGGSLGEIARARAQAMRVAAKTACAGRDGCRRALDRIGRGRMDGRAYDTALALVGAAKDRPDFEALVRRLGTADLDGAEIRRRAFASTYRFGDGEVLGNLLGYRAGTCDAYRSSRSSAPDGLAAVLLGVLRCEGGEDGSEGLTTGRTGCVFVAPGDVVTPEALSEAWWGSGSDLKRAGTVSGHAMVDGGARRVMADMPGSLQRCS